MNDGDKMNKDNFDFIINDISNSNVVRIWLKNNIKELIQVDKNRLGSVNIFIDTNYFHQNEVMIEQFVCDLIN